MVEKPASFKGGVEGWRRYLERSLRYPEKAVNKNIQGLVRVKFTIYKDVSISNIGMVESPDEMLSQEALRIIKTSGKWEPALKYDRKVVYRQIQGVTFSLQ